MILTQQQKEGFQNSWDSDWLIDSNNYRKEAVSKGPATPASRHSDTLRLAILWSDSI